MIGSMVAVLAVTTCQPSLKPHPDPDGVVGRMREAMWRGEMTEHELLLKIEELARKYRDLVDATAGPENFLTSASPEVDRCMGALTILERTGDRHSLPLFEEMTESKHVEIRLQGMRGYFKVAGVVDSLPFISRVADGKPKPADMRSQSFNRTAVYLALGWEVWRSPPPPEDVVKVCAFMLGKAKTGDDGMVRRLDGVFCENLTGYKDSTQRKEIAEKFAQSKKEDIRNHWKAIKEEIEKTPAKERKDFRAKGELLDPKRKKEP